MLYIFAFSLRYFARLVILAVSGESAERRTSTVHKYEACQKILHDLVQFYAENEHHLWLWEQSSVPQFAVAAWFPISMAEL